jgi:hypothetical protein
MAGEDRIEMGQQDLKRWHIMQKVLEGTLTQVAAGRVLSLSPRQIRRIGVRIETEGQRAVIHKLRGRPSNHRTPDPLKHRILRLYQTRYHDFGPTLASEKLWERDKIKIHQELLRLWLIEKQIPYRQRKKRPHRHWRLRKASFGEMVQLDGSHHDWLEGRGPWMVLMAYKDDATGEVFARFYHYEGTVPAMDSFKRYIAQYGIPQCIYLDKHSTYKGRQEPTVQEQLQGLKAMSQFERALHELSVKVIHAHSPQAKGRIERQFRTFQHRLVRELRLAKINNMPHANDFLEKYLPRYNAQFNVPAQNTTDLHRPVERINLNNIFCFKEVRCLRNDFTVLYRGALYQVLQNVPTRQITIEQHLDGAVLIKHHGRSLSYQLITRKSKIKPKLPNRFRFRLRRKTWKNPQWSKFVINTNKIAA